MGNLDRLGQNPKNHITNYRLVLGRELELEPVQVVTKVRAK